MRASAGKPVIAARRSIRYKAMVFSSGKMAPRGVRRRRKELQRWAWLTFGAWIALASLLLISCSTVDRTGVAAPEINGATFAGNAACVDCHDKYTRAFAASPHARLHVETAQILGSSGCESCHGPGSKHIAGGGGRGRFIANPGKDPQACFACHVEINAEFNLPQHHPVREGKMSCVPCHDAHGFDIMKPAGGLAMARRNEQCAGCHREQTKRVVFEHEALREGCNTCHQPHGSVNGKMLAQPDANLCLRCHAQMQTGGQLFMGKSNHTRFLSRGTCWTSGCHTAVHGSNVDPYLRY